MRKTRENSRVIHARITAVKNAIAIHYCSLVGGSCINKYDKLMDISIQVLCIAKISVFVS